MDTSDYDQLTVSGKIVGDNANFMMESMMVTIAIHEGSPLYIELPPSVTMEITYTEPGLQGDRSTGGTKQEQIDEFLGTYSQGWTLDRMPSVDRIILRLGTWELLYNDDVPDKVAISEAVELAKALSTDESPAFINGLLGRLQQLKPSLLA